MKHTIPYAEGYWLHDGALKHCLQLRVLAGVQRRKQICDLFR